MIRVLIADDQELVRSGFRLILDAHDDIEVVADAADGVDAVRAARALRPDVCLMDIRMPGIDGLEATSLLCGPQVADPLKVVVVTTFDLDEYVEQALRSGASGFLLKDAGATLLVEAIRAAERGDALVSPQITVRLLRYFARLDTGLKGGTGQACQRGHGCAAVPSSTPAPMPAMVPAEALTERETEVVRATARGLTNGEIAKELFVSLSSVKQRLATAQAKLGARNRVATAAWAWRSGLMDGA